MKAIGNAGLVLALLSVPLVGCGNSEDGNGVIVDELREVSDWRRIDVCCGLSAEVTRGVNRGVMVTGDENLLELITIRTRGDTLVVEVEPMTSIHPTRPIRIAASTEALFGVDGSGGSSLTIAGVDSPELEIGLSGGSQAVLDGAGRDLRASLSGGSQLDARAFPVVNADVDASGGSVARLNCSTRLTGSLSGGSELFVTGRPSQSVDASGGSRVVLQ